MSNVACKIRVGRERRALVDKESWIGPHDANEQKSCDNVIKATGSSTDASTHFIAGQHSVCLAD